jgi:hypothetical protein
MVFFPPFFLIIFLRFLYCSWWMKWSYELWFLFNLIGWYEWYC